MKKIALGIVSIAFALVGCSQMTVLRTEEMRNVGTDVQVAVLSNLDSAMHKLRADNKNLRKRVDSLKAELLAQQEASALLQKRMMAELTMLSRRVSDESERNDSRQEEIIYRLDMLLGKSDKILAKKVVVSGAPQQQVSMDSVEREAERGPRVDVVAVRAVRGEGAVAVAEADVDFVPAGPLGRPRAEAVVLGRGLDLQDDVRGVQFHVDRIVEAARERQVARDGRPFRDRVADEGRDPAVRALLRASFP